MGKLFPCLVCGTKYETEQEATQCKHQFKIKKNPFGFKTLRVTNW